MLEELQHHYPLDLLQRVSHAAIDALQVLLRICCTLFLDAAGNAHQHT